MQSGQGVPRPVEGRTGVGKTEQDILDGIPVETGQETFDVVPEGEGEASLVRLHHDTNGVEFPEGPCPIGLEEVTRVC